VAAVVLRGVLGALEQLHILGYLHADVKPDNYLLVLKNSQVQVVGIDLGRAVDIELEPARFESDMHIRPYMCPEMEKKTRAAFIYQIDMYGAAVIAFGIIFGCHWKMKVERVKHPDTAYKLEKDFPDAMPKEAREVWTEIFARLLNGKVGVTAGRTHQLRTLRELQEKLESRERAENYKGQRQLISLVETGYVSDE
jgi:checkpoint serine/threonine-protein kinase